NNLWNEICCQEYGEDQSYFKKAKESAGEKKITLISHDHFLRDRARKNPQITLPENTIVGELDNFVSAIEYSWHIQLSESKFLTNLNAIKKDNPDSSEVLDHIAGKISILFGFLGMVIQKHGEEKDPRHLLIVEAFHRNTEQWNKVIKSSESIYAAISALGEDIKASGPRDELEGHIHYLNKILLTNGPALWITLSQDQKIIIHAFPEHTDQIFQERVWKTDSELHLFSHHGDTGDDFNFLKSQLAIPLDTNIHKNDDVYPLPLFTPEKPLSNPNENRNIPEVVNEISKMLPEIEGNAMLLVTSKNSAEQFFYKFPKLMEETGRKLLVQNMGGGMGKIYKMSQKTDGKNFFIGNEYFMKFLLSEGVKLNFLGMHRLPFSHPNSPMQKTRSKNFSDPYKEFSLPQTNINYRGIIHRFLGNEWENKKILVLDPRVSRLN
ncbi:hypothetical protein HOK22_03860, partial [Candidatus Peregrinibacteria bacterium]|nr:hypothetical protein [Candidatus Peregrinibacteria bacterium]